MTLRSFGVDLSHWQRPAALPWERLARDCSFILCRATYGTTRDREVLEHVKRVRDTGCALGLYHFYRPSQAVADQFSAFGEVASAVGLEQGDILPAFDVEDDRTTPLTRSCSEPLEDLAVSLSVQYSGAIAYCSEHHWIKLGRPSWLLAFPLWVPFYSRAAIPRTPGGKPWTIWQYRVGPYDPAGLGGYAEVRGAIDHNIAAASLPKIECLAPLLPRAPLPPPDGSLLPRQDEVDGVDDDGPSWEELRARAHAQHFDLTHDDPNFWKGKKE